MRAIRIDQHGGPEVLQATDVDDPVPGPRQVLVEVAAAGVNFVDTYHRGGTYPLELPSGLGVEGTGTVVAVGDDVTDRMVGERVGWTGALGSYAQRVTIAADRTVRIPDTIDDATATALLLQGMTAHYLTYSTYRLGPDDTILVYAPAGGVGRTLVQLAVKRGARVLAATSTDEKASIATRLGADAVIRYREVDVPTAVAELTDGHGVDVVYDSVGRDTFEGSLQSLRPRGLLVLYGAASGPVPPVDLQILNKHGSLFVTRPSLGHYVTDEDELAWRAGSLFELVANGSLETHVHATYPLEEAASAHAALESGKTTGKLLLQP